MKKFLQSLLGCVSLLACATLFAAPSTPINNPILQGTLTLSQTSTVGYIPIANVSGFLSPVGQSGLVVGSDGTNFTWVTGGGGGGGSPGGNNGDIQYKLTSTTFGGYTPAAGFVTFMQTATSSNLAALVTNETGTGPLVFATSPTLVTPALGTIASGNGAALTALTAANITAGALANNMAATTQSPGNNSTKLATTAYADAAAAARGDVVGPSSSTDNALARFDSITGKLIQNSVVTVGDTGAIAGILTLNGLTLTASTGTLTLTNAKVFSVTDNITLSSDGTGTRTLNVGTGGTLGTAAYTAASAYVPAYAGLTTNGLLQATSATTVASTLTPSGLTSIGVNTIISDSAVFKPASANAGTNFVSLRPASGDQVSYALRWDVSVSANIFTYTLHALNGANDNDIFSITGDSAKLSVPLITLGRAYLANGNLWLHNFAPSGAPSNAGNTFLGDAAGNLSMTFTSGAAASFNIALGYQAMTLATTANKNALVGWSSGRAMTSGFANTGIGYQTLLAATTGSHLVALGTDVLMAATTATNAVGVGVHSLQNLTTAVDVVAVGEESGNALTTNGGGVYLGAHAGKYATAANEFYLGNQDFTNNTNELTNSLLYGVFSATPGGQSLRINADTTRFSRISSGSTGSAILVRPIATNPFIQGEDGGGTLMFPTNGNTRLYSSGAASELTLVADGTATLTGNLTVTANVTSPRFTSNVTTGTSPFVVSSTTQVANLNAATAGVANAVSVGNITGAGTGVLAALANATNTTNGLATYVLGSSSAFGLVKVDGSSITASGGVISATTGGGGNVTNSGTLVSGNIVVGGGTTVVSTVATGTNVVGALGVNVGSAGAVVLNGGVLGTPSSGTATNLSGTATALTAGNATTLATPRAIYGNNFDGSAALTQIIASTFGGTGNGFTKISGPTTSEKTFTLPDANMTIFGNTTKADVLEGGLFAADSGTTDAYAAALSPAITAYVTGAFYSFSANTTNVGAASINLNSLGAKTIKKVTGGITTDLADNDIRSGQVVMVQYDGTNMQIQSTLGNAATGTGNVTNSGTLTNTAIATGAGTTVVQTPSATSTLDASGNMALAGNLTVGTSNKMTAGTIELGAASDTTVARVSAGIISVEGATVYTQGGALGTPASGTGTNITGIPEGGLSLTDITTNNVSTTKHGFAPKLPNDATKYLDGTGAYSVPAGGGGSTPNSPLFSATADGTNNATASDTSIIGTGSGSKTTAANYFSMGTGLQMIIAGTVSTAVAPDNLTIKIKAGSVTVASATGVGLTGALSGSNFQLYALVTCRTAGASGVFKCNAILMVTGSALTPLDVKIVDSGNAVDTTGTIAWDITAAWASTTAGDIITGTNFSMATPGTGMTDPGFNGYVKRTALNTTSAVALIPTADGGTNSATAYGAYNNLTLHAADIASASTLNLDAATGQVGDITGTTTITGITLADGHKFTTRFTGSLLLTNGASLVLPGGQNITTKAGDIFKWEGYPAGVVYCSVYTPVKTTFIAGMPLPNVVFPRGFFQTTATGDSDIYTVPTGQRAIITQVNADNTSAGTIVWYTEVKHSGTYYRISNNVSTVTGATPSVAGNNGGIILEAGDTFSVNTTTNTGLSVSAAIIQYDNTSSVKSAILYGLSTGQNTLYTVPSGKSALILSPIIGTLPIGGSTSSGAVNFVSDSGGTRTITGYNVPSGGSPGTTNQTSPANTNAASTRASATFMGIHGSLASQDYISINVDTGNAAQIAWLVLVEL